MSLARSRCRSLLSRRTYANDDVAIPMSNIIRSAPRTLMINDSVCIPRNVCIIPAKANGPTEDMTSLIRVRALCPFVARCRVRHTQNSTCREDNERARVFYMFWLSSNRALASHSQHIDTLRLRLSDE